jgi:hypothetical protein
LTRCLESGVSSPASKYAMASVPKECDDPITTGEVDDMVVLVLQKLSECG